jgi:2-methylisocitrate lyase-like PEP mutase family enzyme
VAGQAGPALATVAGMTTSELTSPAAVPAAQVRRAEAFARLHQPGRPLLLPNAWDVASAVLIAAAGAPAVATTSGGVAWSLGVPDAADLGAGRAAAVIERIAAAVPVPVSADIEAGYGPGTDAVLATVTAVVRAGAVGINIEDRLPGQAVLLDPAEQADRLAAARTAAGRLGLPLWINARTDVFLAGQGPAARLLEAAADRAVAYAAAGADSIFVPGLTDPAAIAELAAGPLPVAVMAGPGAPPAAELAAAGAARISLGTAIAQAAYAVAARAATELLTAGTYTATAGGIDYGELNAALSRAGQVTAGS